MLRSIVILQKDPARVEILLPFVQSISETVFAVHSLPELQSLLARRTVQIGVLDLDLVTPEEIARLRQQVGMEIICTHRLADDSRWSEVLAAGAIDFCFDDDAPAISRAIQRTRPNAA